MLNVVKRRFCSDYRSKKWFLERLTERSLLKISGDEVVPFLQGLITNDMKHLTEGSPSMYGMFLNSKGRVLYDVILYKTPQQNSFFIESDSSAIPELKKHLTLYKVRRKIEIQSLENEFSVWNISSSDLIDKNVEEMMQVKADPELLDLFKKNLVLCWDPRITALGLRAVVPNNVSLINEMKDLLNIQEENHYKVLRYKLGVGEGVKELPLGNCFPLEANCDYLHGVSFHKGCYIGQEVTARTHHTGVVRKRLMPIYFQSRVDINETDAAILSGDKSVGKLRGVEQTFGIALLRIEEALRASQLIIKDQIIKTSRPFWWPSEAPKERVKIA